MKRRNRSSKQNHIMNNYQYYLHNSQHHTHNYHYSRRCWNSCDRFHTRWRGVQSKSNNSNDRQHSSFHCYHYSRIEGIGHSTVHHWENSGAHLHYKPSPGDGRSGLISISRWEQNMWMNILSRECLRTQGGNLFEGMDLQFECSRIPSNSYGIESYRL